MTLNLERKFIHDISGVLGTAVLCAEEGVAQLQEMASPNPDLAVTLLRITESLEKAMALIQNRRADLLSAETKT